MVIDLLINGISTADFNDFLFEIKEIFLFVLLLLHLFMTGAAGGSGGAGSFNNFSGGKDWTPEPSKIVLIIAAIIASIGIGIGIIGGTIFISVDVYFTTTMLQEIAAVYNLNLDIASLNAGTEITQRGSEYAFEMFRLGGRREAILSRLNGDLGAIELYGSFRRRVIEFVLQWYAGQTNIRTIEDIWDFYNYNKNCKLSDL